MSGFVERSRQALRLLARHKRFSGLAILSLAMAIALNTTMYSVLDSMIAPKLLIGDHERLYNLQYYGNFRRIYPMEELQRSIREGIAFADGMTSYRRSWDDRIVEGGGNVLEVQTMVVLPNYFQVLRVRASAGRLLSPADLGSEGRPVVVSEQVWKGLFPDKKQFEPTTIIVGGEPAMAVGTLPYQADLPGNNTGVWLLPPPQMMATMGVGLVRLKDGVELPATEAELRTLNFRLAQLTHDNPADVGFRIWSATKRPFRVGRFHFALVGSVVAVLLVACANLANLQLARGVSRSRELATRAAVGATRGDIITQLVVESGWLAFGGLLLGAVFTVWGMKMVDATVPPRLFEYVTHPQMSWRVAAFSVTATLFSLVLVGLAPAWRLSRVDINELIKSGAGTGSTRSARRQYGVLVAVEVALALSVLCSAGLLMKAAFSVLSFDGGIEGIGMVSTTVSVAPESPNDRRTRQDWTNRLLAAARGVPAITSAAVVTGVRPKTKAIAADDRGGKAKDYDMKLWGYRVITPDFLRTTGRRIVKGRDFLPGDAEASVIIDRGTAAYLWPGQEPIGRMIKLDSSYARAPWLRVIGVVENYWPWFRTDEVVRSWAQRPRIGDVYVLQVSDTARIPAPTSARRYSASFTLVVRGAGDPRKIPTVLRRNMGDMGPRTFVSYPSTWEQQTGIDQLRAKHTFMASLFLLFGVMALALATLGVYAIIAHMVAQRTREFGVRIAIGAATRDIRNLVVREGNILTLLGIAVGLLFTAYSAGFVREFVFSDDDRYDSRVFALVCVTIFAVAWLASYLPARRAMRIDPVEALRND